MKKVFYSFLLLVLVCISICGCGDVETYKTEELNEICETIENKMKAGGLDKYVVEPSREEDSIIISAYSYADFGDASDSVILNGLVQTKVHTSQEAYAKSLCEEYDFDNVVFVFADRTGKLYYVSWNWEQQYIITEDESVFLNGFNKDLINPAS